MNPQYPVATDCGTRCPLLSLPADFPQWSQRHLTKPHIWWKHFAPSSKPSHDFSLHLRFLKKVILKTCLIRSLLVLLVLDYATFPRIHEGGPLTLAAFQLLGSIVVCSLHTWPRILASLPSPLFQLPAQPPCRRGCCCMLSWPLSFPFIALSTVGKFATVRLLNVKVFTEAYIGVGRTPWFIWMLW